jgi:hypothetical protein
MRFYKTLAIAVLVAAALPRTAAAQNANNYILQSPSLAQAQAACQTYGLTLVATIHAPDTYLVQASVVVPPQALSQWTAGDPNVKHIEPSKKLHVPENAPPPPPGTPPSPASTFATGPLAKTYGSVAWAGYVQQPALVALNAPPVTSPNSGGGGVIAIIDTGVDPTNAVLAPVIVPGYDFTTNTAGYASELGDVNQSTAHILFQSTAHILFGYQVVPVNPTSSAILDPATSSALQGANLPNDFGHGTMVAGLIHLIAPTAQIMPLKAFLADGTADESNVISAIYYATDHGASVINMSFGFSDISDALMKAINYASRKGVVCVASVGNSSQSSLVYPAAFGNVIGVASVNQQNKISSFSNYGPDMVTVAAPGEALITTYPGNHYAAVWGTSFSAALVSGAADLLIQSAKDNLTNQLQEADFARALKHASPCATDDSLGAGCVDLAQAIQFIQSMNMQPSPKN